MEHTAENLTKEMRWKIADWLAEDRLDSVNELLDDVIVKGTFYKRYGKRLLDIIISLLALILTLPINFVIGIITFFDVGRPIFFRQARVGKDGKIFTIVKFRSMRNTYDDHGELLPPNQRVTKWGKFVRKTSLDELLNFWCVLKGDMSIIGPRPLPPEYAHRYNRRHKARLAVRPGLECPPRVLAGRARTWQDHLDNDVWYVENVSFLTDIIMCFCLVRYALDRKSSTSRATAGTGTFMGYDMEGRVLTLENLPQEYIERAFAEIENKSN